MSNLIIRNEGISNQGDLVKSDKIGISSVQKGGQARCGRVRGFRRIPRAG